MNYQDKLATEAGCYFDQAAADKARKFIERFCRQSKGEYAGESIKLLPFQWEEIVKPLFGWRRKDGTRRYRQASIWLPTGNGKSTLMAAISLYMLLGDGEKGASVIAVANTREQATAVYGEAKNMVLQSALLSKHCKVFTATKRMTHEATFSKYECIAANEKSVHGSNPSCVIYDEIGAARNRDIFAGIRKSVQKRKQPLIITISHAYPIDTESVGYENYTYAKKVEEGEVDDWSFLPVIYAADEREDDWQSEEVWKRVNPGWDVTFQSEQFKAIAEEAKHSLAKQHEFKIYNLNMWVGCAQSFIGIEKWKACQQDFTEADFEGATVWGGGDLSRTLDLTAVVYLAERDDKLFIIPRIFTPAATMAERGKKDGVPYKQWAEQGYLIPVPGDMIDTRFVRNQVLQDAEKFNIASIGYDSWGTAPALFHEQLNEEDGIDCVAITQNYEHLGRPTAEFENRVNQKTIVHDGNPVLSWCISNAALKMNEKGECIIDKKTALRDRRRIDAVTASILALHRYMADDDSQFNWGIFIG